MMRLARDEDFACPGQSGHGAEWPVSAIRSYRSGSEETVLHHLGDGRGARGDIQFIQDIGDVSVDRVFA